MTQATSIEWTDVTWNPVRGCSRVSEGCRNCYAEKIATRFSGEGQAFHGYAEWRTKGGHLIAKGEEKLWTPQEREGRWTGVVGLVVDKVDEPLRWQKAHRVFVNSMSDFFHEELKDESRDELFAVMALCGLEGRSRCLNRGRGHEHGFDCDEWLVPAQIQTFQILTKRAEVMHRYMNDPEVWGRVQECADGLGWFEGAGDWLDQDGQWPPPNVLLGVSVEDQKTANERVGLLVGTPAAKRFVSYEPALEAVDFHRWLCACEGNLDRCCRVRPRLDWIIVGGESGPDARRFELEWARAVVVQCKAAGVPVFVKQLGSRPYELDHRDHPEPWHPFYGGCDACEHSDAHHHTGKNGDMKQWPEDLQVREFPS